MRAARDDGVNGGMGQILAVREVHWHALGVWSVTREFRLMRGRWLPMFVLICASRL